MLTVQVLTKRHDGAGHHSTEVTIDWGNISQEQLMLLARARIIDRWQRSVKVTGVSIPAEVTLKATDFVQPDEVISDEPLNLPKPRDRSLDKLLAGLSAQDKKQMLALLEGL